MSAKSKRPKDSDRLDWAISNPDRFNGINTAELSETAEAAKVRVRKAIDAALAKEAERPNQR